MNKINTSNLQAYLQKSIAKSWPYLLIIAAALLALATTTHLSLKAALMAFGGLLIAFILVDLAMGFAAADARPIKAKNKRPSTIAKPNNNIVSSLIDGLPSPMLILNENNLLLFANEAMRSLYEIPRERQDISAIIRSPELLEAIQIVARTKDSQTIQLTQRLPIKRQFILTITWILDASISPSQESGDSPAMVVHFHDLSQQEQVNRMRSDFIANASHELRTPLASLLGFIETLQGPARNDEQARDKFLEVMAAQGKRMTRLIDDLLSLSRIEMNAHTHLSDKVDVTVLMRETLDVLEPLSQSQNISLSLDIGEEPIYVIGDKDELSQVFQNLVHNAIKYGQPDQRNENSGPQVEITVSNKRDNHEAADKIYINIKDQGVGIAAKHIPRLTERFYRVDVEKSREKGGTGLGLAIVKHILTHHKGELKIKSTPGNGSVFTIILPRA